MSELHGILYMVDLMNRGLQFPGFTKKKTQYYLLLPTIRTFIFLKEIQLLKHNLRNLP